MKNATRAAALVLVISPTVPLASTPAKTRFRGCFSFHEIGVDALFRRNNIRPAHPDLFPPGETNLFGMPFRATFHLRSHQTEHCSVARRSARLTEAPRSLWSAPKTP